MKFVPHSDKATKKTTTTTVQDTPPNDYAADGIKTTVIQADTRLNINMGLAYNTYLNSNKIYGCKSCKAHLANHEDIISRVSRHGKRKRKADGWETERKITAKKKGENKIKKGPKTE